MKKFFKTVGKYLREVSVVVIGVAVTLYASQQIGLHNKKRDLSLYLHAIKLESEKNIEFLNTAIKNMRHEVAYSDYLRSTEDIKSSHPDTLARYEPVAYMIMYGSFQANAFEMFRNSGTMRLLEDKELLLSIWDIYDKFHALKEGIAQTQDHKFEERNKEITILLSGKELQYPPMYNYHMTSMTSGWLNGCEAVLEKLKVLVATLEALEPAELKEPAIIPEIQGDSLSMPAVTPVDSGAMSTI